MSEIADRITHELRVIVGRPITDCWRGGDMQIFGFGIPETFVDRRGDTVTLARYRLHVQCHWRLVDSERILFSGRDLHQPADFSINAWEFDWKKQLSLLDVKQKAWSESHRMSPLKVVRASGDPYGGCRIDLEREHALECVPFDTGPEHEHWRFFDMRGDRRHFLSTSDNIQESP